MKSGNSKIKNQSTLTGNDKTTIDEGFENSMIVNDISIIQNESKKS